MTYFDTLPAFMNLFTSARVASTRSDFRAVLCASLLILTGELLQAEIIFQDFFNQTADDITNSVPWLDVQGGGWQVASSSSSLATDGQGHLYNPSTVDGGSAGVQLIPIGPHGSMAASADINLP